MKDEIVVIGGYGNVGGLISRALGARWPGKVYAAGRNLSRATQFTSATFGQIKPLMVDVQDDAHARLPAKTRLVVMCLDLQDTRFAERCLHHGIDYVDVSSNLDCFNKMEQIQQQGKLWSATAVLSVGLAPGLSNLMAKAAARLLEQTARIDIAVLLGLGDVHGRAAMEWTVDSLHTVYSVMEQGQALQVRSFTDPKRFQFGAHPEHPVGFHLFKL
ncbi:saccharopine dehydrogenase NADP-binding domain-containing protein [Paenibacillus sp. IB182496]|uniref:Saccharopine dehydrogenase NADP-binding domain-containing protein n=1 Tax=Paenibacillus sabuli TaxID=2772509 RepID=A0A927GSQ2_9BACL|nr:saccharopine dehydrogenase NADP-binding domain-containing protein [Paenibacillus sabuli]MBD2846526.1 saccharopine dehydrogenase NADP-binding domain-containing protein [Paenibacillus sabuli]